ncbi:MAG: S1 RNA-binding domain-containing protein, partial [Methylococcaceae bacterium]
FDPLSHRLLGERTNTTFRLGDSVKVKVVRVDLDEKKIDFELVEKEGAVKKAKTLEKVKKKRKRKPKSG